MSRTLATHALRHPIVLTTRPAGSEEANEEELKPAGFTVVLKRPRAKDMKVFDSHADRPMEGMIALIARISNLDLTMAENLDNEDFGFLGDLAVPESRSGLTTGPTA